MRVMGKRGGWISAVRRALYSDPKEKKHQKLHKSKRKWFWKKAKAASDAVQIPVETEPLFVVVPPLPPPSPPLDNVKLAQVEDEQSKRAFSVALATALVAVAAAQAAAEVVRLILAVRYPEKSKEENAAIRIQTSFRGYSFLKARIGSSAIGKSSIHMLARLQSQVRARRIRMSEDNQALQRQLQKKQEKEIEKPRIVEKWNHSTQSKEQMEANLLHKQQAAIRRERVLAYAFSHQKTWKNSKSTSQTFMDPINPHWGWNWLEGWMASRPVEASTTPGKNNDRASMKSEGATSTVSVGEINCLYPSSQNEVKKHPSSALRPIDAHSQNFYSPSTPTSNESRSMFSVQSEMVSRHSIAGSSSAKDDESLTIKATVPSYKAPTKSAKAKSRAPSPLTVDMADKVSVWSARKRLSFPSSPGNIGSRRHAETPKEEGTSIKGIGM